MIETDKIIIKKTEFQSLEKILDFEKDNSHFVKQYSLAEHKEILENEYHLSIFEKEKETLVGYIILVGILDKNKSIEFRRIVISKKRLGYGKDAVKLIKKFCFNVLGANKIWLDVYDDNEIAIQIYESEGFRKKSSGNMNNGRCLLIMSINNQIE